MENYLVSARKYRPDTFRSVVGQQALTTTLKNAIRNKQLAQAYLFCGPRGVGKTTCARIFAKAINCTNPTADGEACNECESCRSFNEQRSLNIFELDAASNNSVDDIRELTEQVRIPPQLGKYKVYIIDEVHMLSTAAFNAFLKTLEEPPAHAVFVLATTEKHKIIPTILSRCQIYDFHRIGLQDITEHLAYVASQEGIEAEAAALDVIALKADGGMRDALSIFDQSASFGNGKITYKGVIDNLNVLDYDYYFRLTDCCLSGRVTDALLLFDEVLNLGFEGLHFINGFASHLRDLMVCKDPRSVKLLEVGADIREKYLKQAAACGFDYLLKALKLTNECAMQYAASKNKRLLVELCLMRLCVPSADAAPASAPTLAPARPAAASTPAAASAPAPASTPAPAPAAPATPAPAAPLAAPAPVAASAPAPAPAAPASAPSVARPAPQPAAAPKTFSIRSLKNKPAETEENDQIVEAEENQSFTEDDLCQAWQAYADTVTADPLLKSSLTSDRPKLLSPTEFEFSVFNPNLEHQLLGLKIEIERFLHARLHNTHLTMQVRLTEGEEKKKALSARDQLKLMVENNPAIADLGRQLSLELE